ncbi:MAG: hypothetical protein M3Q16_03285 [Pseudomonadota bacterium]|nr:hypothetical protein [Pseudomonadota bacterium]
MLILFLQRAQSHYQTQGNLAVDMMSSIIGAALLAMGFTLDHRGNSG